MPFDIEHVLCIAIYEDNLSPLTILGGLGAKFSVGLFRVFFLFSMFGGGDSWSLRKVRNLCGIHNTHSLQQGAELLQNCPKFQFSQFQSCPKFKFPWFPNCTTFQSASLPFLYKIIWLLSFRKDSCRIQSSADLRVSVFWNRAGSSSQISGGTHS